MKWANIIGAGALVLGATTVASAQGSTKSDNQPAPKGPQQGGATRVKTGERGGREQMDRMLFKGITLTEAQKAAYKELNAAQEAEMKALFQSFNGQRPDQAGQNKMRALREKQRKEYRAVLTSDQQTLYDKNVAELQAEMQRRMQGRMEYGSGR